MGDSFADPCASARSYSNVAVIVATTTVIGTLLLTAAVGFVIYPRVRMWWSIQRRHKGTMLSGTEFDTIKSSQQNLPNDFEIERQQDMEVHTASGKFVIKLNGMWKCNILFVVH